MRYCGILDALLNSMQITNKFEANEGMCLLISVLAWGSSTSDVLLELDVQSLCTLQPWLLELHLHETSQINLSF